MSRSISISLSLALAASCVVSAGSALAQDAQPKWMTDISNSMNAAAAGAPVLEGGQPTGMSAGSQPKWMSDIGNSMNAAAGTTVVDVPAPPAAISQSDQASEQPEFLGDSIPLTLPRQTQQNYAQAQQTFTSPYNTTNMAMPFNTTNMSMPFNNGENAAAQAQPINMGAMPAQGMQGGCGGHFHGCCGGHHGQQQQTQDPCKMFFGVSQQEVGVGAAVAGMMLYPNIVKSLWHSNPQMQTRVSRFLGSGPAAGF